MVSRTGGIGQLWLQGRDPLSAQKAENNGRRYLISTSDLHMLIHVSPSHIHMHTFKGETWKAHIRRKHYFDQYLHSKDLHQVSFLQCGLNILGRMRGTDRGYHSVEEASLPPALYRFLGLTVLCLSDLKIEQQIIHPVSSTSLHFFWYLNISYLI